ncbi:MAG TPA: tetratricopeptide repeat protein [Candidatus Deferrimicrobium sp.]|nr:tetratricopeptide repeat protein [Candidatus Deferrimicrobium sp.]
METYRLKSKLVENDKEFVIHTSNDTNQGAVLSTIYVDGQLTEKVTYPHPLEIKPEEVLSLVRVTHEEQKKEIETLLDAYRKALAGADVKMLYHLGTAFFYKRFFEEAKQLFEAAILLDPQDHQALNHLGMTQLALNEVTAAVDTCAKAVEKRPNYADYRNNLGEAHLAAGNARQAVRELEDAIRINLYYGDAYLNLGLAYVLEALSSGPAPRADLPEKAVDCFKKAGMIHADYEPALLEQGLNALYKSDFRQTYQTMLTVREARKERHRREFATFYMKYVLYPGWISEETLADRIQFLRGEIQKNPTYVDLYPELGRCLLEYARLSWYGALQQYQRALQINPSLASAQRYLPDLEREYESLCSVVNSLAEKG